jgi:hypothetical protein
MSRDSRSEELQNLKLALAAFELQLNAFEARLKMRSFETSAIASPPPVSDVQFAQKILWAMKGASPDRQLPDRQLTDRQARSG